LIVFNGEGSAHHDNARIAPLLAACATAKRRHGTRLAFVNAVWQDNSRALGAHLKSFDYVSVRERRSAEQISKWAQHVAIVPDLLFGALRPGRSRRSAEDAATYLVTDSVMRTRADALHDFASFHALPFYLMGASHLREYSGDPEIVYRVGREVFPQLMEEIDVLNQCGACVTGRFHTVVACLVNAVPVAALPSNTHKTEAILQDIGLEDHFLLPDDWSAAGNLQRMEMVRETFGRWNLEQWQKVTRYVAEAKGAIERSFQDLQGLVASSPWKRRFRLFGH
jgi:polysaccharide pyruvyl transferase WcaK-like protein